MALNNIRINSLIRQAKETNKELEESDGAGLTLRIKSNGSASWRLRYRIAGKQKIVVIGQYPTWGLSDARERAKELRRQVDIGSDVALEKKRQKQEAKAEWSVDDLAKYYFDLSSKDLAPHTHKQRVRQYEKYIKPTYGSYKVGSIKPSDIGDSVRSMAAIGKTLPRNILILWTQLYHHAVGIGMVETNPCRDIKAEAITGKEAPPKQRTVLKVAELKSFLHALNRIPRPYELAVRLLLLTGVRVSQLSEAKVGEFDLDAGVWAIPSERRKNRKFTQGPLEVPLPTEALDWVKELITLADRSGYLFHQEGRRHTEGRTPRSKGNTIANWMHRIHSEVGEWRRVTPHDLRATCKSLLSEIRVDYEIRQKYLDHASENQMDRVYDKSELMGGKADAARRLLAYLNRLEADASAQKVVPIR